MTPLESFLIVAVLALVAVLIWLVRRVRVALVSLDERVIVLETVDSQAAEDMALVRRLSTEMAEHFQIHVAQTLARVPNKGEDA